MRDLRVTVRVYVWCPASVHLEDEVVRCERTTSDRECLLYPVMHVLVVLRGCIDP